MLSSVSGYEQQRTMLQPTGGMDQIAKGFEKHVGTMIRYSCVVEKIKQGPTGRDRHLHRQVRRAGHHHRRLLHLHDPLSVLKNVDADFSKPFKAAMSGVAYAPVNKIGLQMKTRFWEENHQIYGGHIYNDMPGVGSITLPSTGWQGQKGVLLGYCFRRRSGQD